MLTRFNYRRLACLFFLGLLLSPGKGSAQQSSTAASEQRDLGIQLYKRGQTEAAINVLTEVVKQLPTDADAWYFLGLAHYHDSSIWLARVAFERFLRLRPNSGDANAKLAYALTLANELERAAAVARNAIELGDQSAEPHYAIAEANFRGGEYSKAIDEALMALKLNSGFAPAWITKSLAHSSLKQYEEAAESLEKFLAINPTDLDAQVWREQLEIMKGYRKAADPVSPTAASKPIEDLPISGREVTTKARVLSKPEPTYTDAARNAGLTGTVVLKCVFSGSGEIKNILVVRSLGYGLTSKAVKAARGIRFVPATKDDRQVSMWMELHYNFNLF